MIDDEMEDRDLREWARRLGERAAERLDVEQTARAVLARLAQEPAPVRWMARPAVWLRIAATILLVVGGGVMLRTARQHPAPLPAAVAGVNVNDLSTDELREVLSSFDQSLDQDPAATEPGLEDLTAPELRRLLRSLEG